MKVLTVRQPWAWALVHGGKTVENRSANIAGSYRGLVAIHAGLQVDWDSSTDPRILQAVGEVGAREGQAIADDALLLGRILGVMELVGSHRALGWNPGEVNKCGPSGLCSPWAEPECWHLELVRPRPLLVPVPFRGSLGLRVLPDDVAAAVEAEVMV